MMGSCAGATLGVECACAPESDTEALLRSPGRALAIPFAVVASSRGAAGAPAAGVWLLGGAGAAAVGAPPGGIAGAPSAALVGSAPSAGLVGEEGRASLRATPAPALAVPSSPLAGSSPGPVVESGRPVLRAAAGLWLGSPSDGALVRRSGGGASRERCRRRGCATGGGGSRRWRASARLGAGGRCRGAVGRMVAVGRGRALGKAIERFRGACLFALGGRGVLRATLLLAFRGGGPGPFGFERAVEGRPVRGGAGWSATGGRFPPSWSGRDRLRGGRTHTIASVVAGAARVAAVAPVTAAVVEGSAPASCPLGL